MTPGPALETWIQLEHEMQGVVSCAIAHVSFCVVRAGKYAFCCVLNLVKPTVLVVVGMKGLLGPLQELARICVSNALQDKDLLCCITCCLTRLRGVLWCLDRH